MGSDAGLVNPGALGVGAAATPPLDLSFCLNNVHQTLEAELVEERRQNSLRKRWVNFLYEKARGLEAEKARMQQDYQQMRDWRDQWQARAQAAELKLNEHGGKYVCKEKLSAAEEVALKEAAKAKEDGTVPKSSRKRPNNGQQSRRGRPAPTPAAQQASAAAPAALPPLPHRPMMAQQPAQDATTLPPDSGTASSVTTISPTEPLSAGSEALPGVALTGAAAVVEELAAREGAATLVMEHLATEAATEAVQYFQDTGLIDPAIMGSSATQPSEDHGGNEASFGENQDLEDADWRFLDNLYPDNDINA